MNELTPEEVREIAVRVNDRPSKSGKTMYPRYINSTDELVERYADFVKADFRARMGDVDTSNRHRKIMENMLVEIKTEQFRHELPALLVLFKRYMTQR
jgi:hypothetical protein